MPDIDEPIPYTDREVYLLKSIGELNASVVVLCDVLTNLITGNMLQSIMISSVQSIRKQLLESIGEGNDGG